MNVKRVTRWMLLVLLGACTGDPKLPAPDRGRVTAAAMFTEHYAHSRMSQWRVRATAAGKQCDVLVIETPVVMEESMVEAMHYGAGAYDVLEGGVRKFIEDRAFRGVVYKDGTGRVWAFDPALSRQVGSLPPCR